MKSRPELLRLTQRMSLLSMSKKENHALVCEIADGGVERARLELNKRGIRWAGQRAKGLHRRCVMHVKDYPAPYTWVRLDGQVYCEGEFGLGWQGAAESTDGLAYGPSRALLFGGAVDE